MLCKSFHSFVFFAVTLSMLSSLLLLIVVSPADAFTWSNYSGFGLNNESISFTFPSNWKLENYSSQDVRNSVLLSLHPPSNPLDYSSKFTIGFESTGKISNLTKYNLQVLKLLENGLEKFSLLDSVPVFFSNVHGERILYTYASAGREIQVMQIWFNEGQTTFIITFATKPSYYHYFLPIVNKILSTLKISYYLPNFTLTDKEKLINYVKPGLFEIQYPQSWNIDQKKNRVSFISPPSGKGDHYLERLDTYLTNSTNLTSPLRNNGSLNQNQLVFSELDYLRKTLSSFNLSSISTENFGNGQARVLNYTYDSNIGPTFVTEYLFNVESKSAILVFSGSRVGYYDTLPMVNQMVSTFSLQ